MQNKGLKTSIAILFLGLLLGIKALDYHPLTHAQDSDPVKCELCVFSLVNEAIAYDKVINTTILPHYSETPVQVDVREPGIVWFEEPVNPTLFGRPPPFLS